MNTTVPDLPPALGKATSGARWQRITLGKSRACVFRLTAPATQPRFLKLATGFMADELLAEAQRLEWLAERLPVPRVLAFTHEQNTSYLLMSAVPGAPASDEQLLTEPARLVQLLTDTLRLVHGLPIMSCPFQHAASHEIQQARRRMELGLVDESDFDAERSGRRAADLFDELLATQPHSEDLVFTHGDFCLPNVLINNDQFSGLIDLGRAGVGDRYRDLALAARSIRYNLGPAWVAPFFAAYGHSPSDPTKLAFFQLLDEFF